MARYRRRSYRGSRDSIGMERARQHIREAEQLSHELGGTDRDVKQYFFSLSTEDLRPILQEYETKYGNSARSYAEKTLPKWRSGRTKMSGTVASRLFNLLPPRMPLEQKFKLTENLWEHVGGSSRKTYYVGPTVDTTEVVRVVKRHLEATVIPHNIPASLERRFSWLAGSDISLKQELLNHFRQQQTDLLSHALSTQLPVLIEHVSSTKGRLTTGARQVVGVGKHVVEVVFHAEVDGITEHAPRTKPSADYGAWVWWVVIAGGIAFWLFGK